MNIPLRVLLVEDSEAAAGLIVEALRQGGYEPTFARVSNAAEMGAALTITDWEVVLSEYTLPGFAAIDPLTVLRQSGRDLPLIVISDKISDEATLTVIRHGAADCLLKDRLGRLGPAVSQAMERNQMRETQKRTAEALLQERSFFNGLVETIPDQIYFKDRANHFIRINEMMARRFGLRAPIEAVGKTDFDFFSEEHARQAHDDEQRVMTTGQGIIGLEEKETWPDGHVTWVSSHKLPWRDLDGNITGLVGISRDITERQHLVEQLRQSQKMEAIGQLSSGVAHDFNNLLSVIKGYIGILRMKGQISPEIINSLQQIDRAADRAANLTRQLLLFSREQAMQPADYNLNGLVLNWGKMLRRLLAENIEIQMECSSQPLMIRADEGMIEQVMLNLVINARDAMPKGGKLRIITGSVELAEAATKSSVQARTGSFVTLAFADSGTGIAPEVLPRIFEPFFTTKEVGKGTGLGLATVYGIMQQHGGWIDVESAVGKGTTFRAYFPRKFSMSSSSAGDKTTIISRGGHEGILLVEDDTMVREIAEAVLSSLGYRVFSTPDGLTALQVWQSHKQTIDLLLTDLVMPAGVDGRELALRLKEENPQLAVIYMSGYNYSTGGADFQLEEGVNYLAKPFDLHQLARIVRSKLDNGESLGPFVRSDQIPILA